MKTNLERFFSSFVTTIVLLLIYAFGLAVATFIEKYHGTATAKAMVYYSPLFFLLQFLLVVNFIAATIKHQYLKRGKWGLMLTHFAFIIILLGALTSFLFGEEGILHLREGETSNQIAVRTSDNTTFHTLPFSVELKKFTLTRYPGSASPSSYESEVIVHVDGEDREERIFMNNVLDVKGYRFFQASYDQDEHGTILSVNRDVAGRNITYTGYLLLVPLHASEPPPERIAQGDQRNGPVACAPCRSPVRKCRREGFPDARCRAEICGEPGTCCPLRSPSDPVG